MNKMIEMLRNVNLGSLRNEKSLDDLIKQCLKEGRKQGALEEIKSFRTFLKTIKAVDLIDKKYNVSPTICGLIEDKLKQIQIEIKELENEGGFFVNEFD